MHEGGPRRNGGIGFSVTAPEGVISAMRSERFALVDERRRGFTSDEVAQIGNLVDEAVATDNLSSSISVKIGGDMLTHVGMGSGTAFRLAIIEGLYILNGNPRGAEHLVRQSGRGGTSGIGITTYFSGGLVLDVGLSGESFDFLPSSRSRSAMIPMALPVVKMPEWPLCICLPRSIRPKSQSEEVEFFRRVLPLEPNASFQAAYEALFGVYAAAAEADFRAFCRAVNAMQKTAWKSAEWKEYGEPLQRIGQRLAGVGADCVGMSSLGPMTFCFGSQGVLDRIADYQDELDCDVMCSAPHNGGRIVAGVACAS
jgi:beta-ribofuranosylaminobenzene 5'-phosphate synthase